MPFSVTRRFRDRTAHRGEIRICADLCLAASSRPPTTNHPRRRLPASGTSASSTPWKPSGLSGVFTSSPTAGIRSFPVNTLNLMRAAVAAQLEGVFEKYVDAAFHHMWASRRRWTIPRSRSKRLTGVRPRRGQAAGPRAGARGQGETDREYARRGRARRVRFADLLRRQGNVLRQGAVARGRGTGVGKVILP